MQQETRPHPHDAAVESKPQSGGTEMDFQDILNEGIDPLDESKKASTKNDQQDMYRLGKVQELKVCFSLANIMS
jgi:hypothetical protein